MMCIMSDPVAELRARLDDGEIYLGTEQTCTVPVRILEGVLQELQAAPRGGRPVFVIAAEGAFASGFGAPHGTQTITVQTPVPLVVGDVLVVYTFAEAMPEWLASLRR
jgi:hypothetical protein